MDRQHYTIRKAEKGEVSLFREWAALEGWNPGLADIEAISETKEAGFFVGFLDNKPIAIFSSVRYDSSFGFVGLYIVSPEYRGRGYGWELWQTGFSHVEHCDLVGLDCVPEQVMSYQRIGFKLAYPHHRLRGKVTGLERRSPHVRLYTEDDFERLAAFDAIFFPAKRDVLLRCWFEQKGAYTLIYERSGLVVGFLTIRPSSEGYKVGPFYAFKKEVADELLSTALSLLLPGSYVSIDIPDSNAQAMQLAEHYNMNIVFSTARMYKGEPPRIPIAKFYGATSFELG